MNTETKLHETLAPLTAKGAPLRARLAHLSYGATVIDRTLEIAALAGLGAELNEPAIERALDCPTADRLRAEIGSGNYPLVNANPGFGAAMLIGICIGAGLSGGLGMLDNEVAARALVGAMACQACLDKYLADMAECGIDDGSWDRIPGRPPEAGGTTATSQLSGRDAAERPAH